MTNETTASQPKSIGDDAQLYGSAMKAARKWARAEHQNAKNLGAGGPGKEADVDRAEEAFRTALDSMFDNRAPAAQASATIQAAPEDDRALRAGRNMMDYAKRAGWPDDGEGAFEFLQRTFYEAGAATIQEPVMVAEPVELTEQQRIDACFTPAELELHRVIGSLQAKNHKFHLQVLRILNAIRQGAESTKAVFAKEGNHVSGAVDYMLAQIAAFGNESHDNDAAPMVADPAGVALTVWCGAMPESNGKSNFTALLMRKGGDMVDGITLDRSEYPDRVRYEADRVRYLLGELNEPPFILDYDADKHSGYVPPAATVKAVPSEAQTENCGYLVIEGDSLSTISDERFWAGDCKIPDGKYRIVSIAAPLADKTGGGE